MFSQALRGNWVFIDLLFVFLPVVVLPFTGFVVSFLRFGLKILRNVFSFSLFGGDFYTYLSVILASYIPAFVVGASTVAVEWKRIDGTAWQKIKAALLYPIFAYTYTPIPIIAMFSRAQWKPIPHTGGKNRVSGNPADIEKGENNT